MNSTYITGGIPMVKVARATGTPRGATGSNAGAVPQSRQESDQAIRDPPRRPGDASRLDLAASDGPPTLCNPESIQIGIGQHRPVRNFLRMGHDVSVKEQIDEPPVVVEELLAFGIHGGALRGVQFRSSRD